MSNSLASFRELKGVGPATEARLHEAGVFTWEALSEVLEAIAAVRSSTGDTLRDLSDQIAERTSAAGAAAAGLPEGERSEAFIVRMSLTTRGQPTRSTVTHVRTQTEKPLAGWPPGEVIRFIEAQSGVVAGPAPAATAATEDAGQPAGQVPVTGQPAGDACGVDAQVPLRGAERIAGEGGVDVLELSFGLVHVRPEPFVCLLDRFGLAPQPIITVENITDRADAVVDPLDPLAGFTQARRLGRPTHDHRVGGGLKFLVDLRPRPTFRSATLGCRRSRPHSTGPESTVEDHLHIRIAGEPLAQVLIEIGMHSVDDKQMGRHRPFGRPRDSRCGRSCRWASGGPPPGTCRYTSPASGRSSRASLRRRSPRPPRRPRGRGR